MPFDKPESEKISKKEPFCLLRHLDSSSDESDSAKSYLQNSLIRHKTKIVKEELNPDDDFEFDESDLFDDYVTPRQAENRKSLLSDEGISNSFRNLNFTDNENCSNCSFTPSSCQVARFPMSLPVQIKFNDYKKKHEKKSEVGSSFETKIPKHENMYMHMKNLSRESYNDTTRIFGDLPTKVSRRLSTNVSSTDVPLNY